jgi:hypothetical protein
VLVADMSMVMFLTGQSGFITLGILSYLVLWFVCSGCSTVVQRLFGVAAGRNGFLILMCQLKNYRPWSSHHRWWAKGEDRLARWIGRRCPFPTSTLLDFQKRHIIPHATYRFSSQ